MALLFKLSWMVGMRHHCSGVGLLAPFQTGWNGELVCSLLFRLDGRTMNVLEVHLESSILSGSMGSLEFQ